MGCLFLSLCKYSQQRVSGGLWCTRPGKSPFWQWNFTGSAVFAVTRPSLILHSVPPQTVPGWPWLHSREDLKTWTDTDAQGVLTLSWRLDVSHIVLCNLPNWMYNVQFFFLCRKTTVVDIIHFYTNPPQWTANSELLQDQFNTQYSQAWQEEVNQKCKWKSTFADPQ